jgi:hypothetical protein
MLARIYYLQEEHRRVLPMLTESMIMRDSRLEAETVYIRFEKRPDETGTGGMTEAE